MNKKRFLSVLLSVLMVFASLPLDAIKVQAAIPASEGLIYEKIDDYHVKVTGYSDTEKAEVERIIIPADVTIDGKEYHVSQIAAGAFKDDGLSNLKEVCVIGGDTEIGEDAIGIRSDGTANTNVTVWCHTGSKADKYAEGKGLSRQYLNYDPDKKGLAIDNHGKDTYYTGCGAFEISTKIRCLDSETSGRRCTDIIWKTSNKDLVWFQDENGNKITESQGTLTENPDSEGFTTSSIKVYVNNTRTEGDVTITADCRGDSKAATQVFHIKKATTKIEPEILIYRPIYEADKNGDMKLKVEQVESGEKTLNYAYYEQVPESELIENGYFDNDVLYVDAGYGYVINGNMDADCNDYCSITRSVDDNSKSLEGTKLSDTSAGNDIEITGVKDKDGNIINENIIYAAKASATNSTVTLFSQNMTLSRKIEVKVCQPASEMKMFMGGFELENGGGYSGLEQSNSTLSVKFTPSDSTDTVVWSSSDPNVAAINDGNKLYLNSSGRARITCTVQNSRSGKRTLTEFFDMSVIEKVHYKEILFAEDETKKNTITEKFIPINSQYTPIICDGTNGKIYVAGNDETAANEPLTYKSSNTNIASVGADGVIKTGTTTGTAQITVTAESGVSKSLSVKVYAPASEISVSTSITIPEGQTHDIPYALLSDSKDEPTEDVKWTSENQSVVIAEDYIDDNGKRFLRLKGVKADASKVQVAGVTLQSGTKVSVQVLVEPAVHADEVSVQLDGDNAYIETKEDGSLVYNIPKGETMFLEAALKSASGVTPNDQIAWFHEVVAGNEIIRATTQDDKTCRVDALKAGNTFVTLKVYGGEFEKLVQCYINVYVPATKIDIALNNSIGSEYMVEAGSTVTLKGVMTPTDSTDTVKWTVNNDNVELSTDTSVGAGTIAMTALKTGKTVLKAQAKSGVFDTVTINVIKKAKKVTFVQDGQEVTEGYVAWKGQTTLSLNVLDEDTTDTTFTWGSVVDNGFLKITPNEGGKSAVIEGLAPGVQQIRVNAPSGFQATLNVKVVVPAETVTLNNTELSIYKGDPAINVEAVLSPSNTTDIIRWSTDKEGIISLMEDGSNSTTSKKVIKVTGVGVGTVYLTATAVSGARASIKINVSAKDMGITTVSDIPAQTYSGKELTPSFNVMNEGKTLRKDTDYTVTYSNNVNAGKATVTIEGTGNYAGIKTVTFDINPKNISSVPNASVAPVEYNGNAQEPEIVLTDSGSGSPVQLVEGKDFTVKYDNNVNAGTATAKFIGTGNYTGDKIVSFQIAQKDMSTNKDIVISPISAMTYTGAARIPEVIVKDGTKVLEKDKDYSVAFSNNVNAGTAKVIVTGRGNYRNFKTAEFTINRRSLSKASIAAIANQLYTGKNITPPLNVTLSGRTLAAGNDYKVSYSKNKNPGKATVKITGTGNYKSSTSKSFIILPLAPKNFKMSSNTSSSVTFKWSKATGATGYYIYAYKASKGKYYKVASTTKNTVKVSKLSAGTDNLYQIFSYVKSGSKTYRSMQYAAATAGTKTKTPSIKKLTTANSSVLVTWKTVKGAQSYTLYYATSKKGKYKKIDVSGTQYNLTGLKAKRRYYFKLKANRNINGKIYSSSYSSIKNIKVKK